MKTLSFVLLSSFVVLGNNPVTAQIRHWTLGGSGDAWEDVRDLNLMSDLTSAPGAMQNLELRPDVNVVPIIYGAHDRRRRLGIVAEPSQSALGGRDSALLPRFGQLWSEDAGSHHHRKGRRR